MNTFTYVFLKTLSYLLGIAGGAFLIVIEGIAERNIGITASLTRPHEFWYFVVYAPWLSIFGLAPVAIALGFQKLTGTEK